MTGEEAPDRNGKESLHVEGVDFIRSPPGENPLGGSLDIVVSVPQSIQIRMVDASTLADYEVWAFLASLLSNGVVGFLVAYLQAVDSKSATASYIGWTLVLFIVLFITALATALVIRRKLRRKSKEVRLKTSGVSQ